MTEPNGKEREQDTRLTKIETDLKWTKWLAGIAAAGSVSGNLLGAQPATALLVSAAVFVVGVVADVVVHLR